MNAKVKLPCVNCITLGICKVWFTRTFVRDNQILPAVHALTYPLLDNCVLLKEFIIVCQDGRYYYSPERHQRWWKYFGYGISEVDDNE